MEDKESFSYNVNVMSADDLVVQGSWTSADFVYGSGHETAAVLLPGFAINW